MPNTELEQTQGNCPPLVEDPLIRLIAFKATKILNDAALSALGLKHGIDSDPADIVNQGQTAQQILGRATETISYLAEFLKGAETRGIIFTPADFKAALGLDEMTTVANPLAQYNGSGYHPRPDDLSEKQLTRAKLLVEVNRPEQQWRFTFLSDVVRYLIASDPTNGADQPDYQRRFKRGVWD